MTEQTLLSVPLSEILADDQFNCRGRIDAFDVADLAEDIKMNGLLQPVLLGPLPKDFELDGVKKYRLVAGFRRFHAHQIIKAEKIRAIFDDSMGDEVKARCFNLTENIQRKDLTIVQEAKALSKLYELGISEVEAAERLNKSRGWIQMRYMTLKLPEDVQKEIHAGVITQSHIRDLYTRYIKGGTKACVESALAVKKAKERGERVPSIINKAKKNKESKKHRRRPEIFDMMDAIRDGGIPNCEIHRALAWAAGEISTGELFESLKEYADRNGYDFMPML